MTEKTLCNTWLGNSGFCLAVDFNCRGSSTNGAAPSTDILLCRSRKKLIEVTLGESRHTGDRVLTEIHGKMLSTDIWLSKSLLSLLRRRKRTSGIYTEMTSEYSPVSVSGSQLSLGQWGGWGNQGVSLGMWSWFLPIIYSSHQSHIPVFLVMWGSYGQIMGNLRSEYS